MHDVVVRAVRKAVSAATIIFTASSIMRFLVIYFFVAKKMEYPTFSPYLADAVRVAAVYEDFNHTPIL